MSLEIRLPNITQTTAEGQLQQMKSYLYQMVEQLNWTVQTLEGGNAGNVLYTGGAAQKDAQMDQMLPANMFNKIKSLIIKSADIINAYYEEISKKLVGEFVAISDFGTYQQKVEALIKATAEQIDLLWKNIQSITDSEDIPDTEIDVSAYLRMGVLYYADDGAPVYGLEIGQTNRINEVETFNKFARFTADRLSFYDANDIEVAYVSDYRLVITNAWVKGNLKLGPGFEFDTTNGLALIWKEEE